MIGRFLSEDLAYDPNNSNLYSYVGNNPMNRIDPSGNILLKIQDIINVLLGRRIDFNDNANEGADYNPDYAANTNQGSVESTDNEVIVKDNTGNITGIYNKEQMKKDFQQLADKQQAGSPDAEDFEEVIKSRYSAFFSATKDSSGVTLIGLRDWGKGTNIPASGDIKGETNGYNDMLLVMDQSGNLSSFSEANFEGSTATGSYYSKKLEKTVTLDGTNPSIVDGTYTLNITIHSGYYALSVDNNAAIPTQGTNPNRPKRNPPYADGVHIHKGGADGWNYSAGCITIRDANGQWERFISIFPSGQTEGTQVGTFNLMSL